MTDTLFIVSLGELSTHVLEATGRSGIFDRIVVGSRSPEKALAKINNALVGCGIDGFFPRFEAIAFDLNDPGSARQLRALDPDIIFSAPSLLPWWKLADCGPVATDVPFAGFASMHLAPTAQLRDRIGEAGIGAVWVAASFPDVVNPCLARTGLGPTCGIGNIQEPIAKIQALVARKLAQPPSALEIRLVAQHAFEYWVFSEAPPDELPPYLLDVRAGGQDHTALGHSALREPFPFPYDLHFNRVTASAAVAGFRALTASSPTKIHLPGIFDLVGGYPVIVDKGRITLDPHPWTREQAVATNEASLPWDGIEGMDADGTIWFTECTIAALRALTHATIENVGAASAQAQAERILSALS
ncbi:hypothetical protein FHS85_004517 [Rhodoligotrophos appendicifer]|uniref:hypothetical protein n=1 Tax=Rhodoligotrophos appendicifer TaxID=987056 RepID=UPI001186B175|nr:hypothetical protein [Rhodoligotrophos appendicifer]